MKGFQAIIKFVKVNCTWKKKNKTSYPYSYSYNIIKETDKESIGGRARKQSMRIAFDFKGNFQEIHFD